MEILKELQKALSVIENLIKSNYYDKVEDNIKTVNEAQSTVQEYGKLVKEAEELSGLDRECKKLSEEKQWVIRRITYVRATILSARITEMRHSSPSLL